MGGAAGHMAHLHENTWLSFGEIKSFLTQVASAELSPIEKVAGRPLFQMDLRWNYVCPECRPHEKRRNR